MEAFRLDCQTSSPNRLKLLNILKQVGADRSTDTMLIYKMKTESKVTKIIP